MGEESKPFCLLDALIVTGHCFKIFQENLLPESAKMGSVGRVLELNTGTKIPLVGLGTAAMNQNPEDIKTAVATAIEVGYRHFDTASLYRSECPLGDALKDAFLKGLVAREEVFVTTKLWCGDLDDPVSALRTSLKSVHLVSFLNLCIYLFINCPFVKEVGLRVSILSKSLKMTFVLISCLSQDSR